MLKEQKFSKLIRDLDKINVSLFMIFKNYSNPFKIMLHATHAWNCMNNQ